jgi:hypothetical protein
MDARTVGRGYGRWPIFQTGTRVLAQKNPGKLTGELFSAPTGALIFLYGCLGPHHLALEVIGDLDTEEIRDGMSGYDLGAGLTGCEGDRVRRVFSLAFSPPFSGKTKVTRELD